MRVAVAIVGFRNRDDILSCLEALGRSTYPDFEVVICENGGPAAYAELTAALPGNLAGGQPVRAVLAPGNLGYAGGVNVCIEASRQAEGWWVLNPDTQPEPGCLAALVERLARGDCDAVGGTLYHAGGKVQAHGGRWRPWLARAESLGHGEALSGRIDPRAVERRQSYIPGASLLIGRRFRDTAGLMREEYFLYCEEVEWCLRALSLGLRLGFAPGARVLHGQGSTTGSADDYARRPRLPIYLDERNKLLVTRDCFPRRLPVAAAAALGLLVLRFARRRAWRQLGYAFAGWRAGLRNERGAPSWLSAG